jgi:DDE superfamily endonuclease
MADVNPVVRYQALVAAVVALASSIDDDDDDEVEGVAPAKKRGPRDKARLRVRRTMDSIFKQYGPYYVRRAYRMTEEAFWQLHVLLQPFMTSTRRKPGCRTKKHKNGGMNGLISTEIRLSAAIRYFAGGRPDDIAISHGIAHSEVFNSVWKVVDAVNACDALAFGFPECHEKQKALALAFKSQSACSIDCCVAATDGLMIWIERPSVKGCEAAHCGAKKFFCGRKHKFGLNLQGTCDAEGRFLDVSIAHPASTSDFLAFTTSRLHKMIEVPGFLAPGLAVFGDSAYVNNGYFVTPFKNVKSGVRDSFNFYQSQLRITIECCFGMFVGRWGLLRRALPQAMSLKKVVGLTLCLVRLHNFCIDKRGKDQKLLAPLASDALEILNHGGIAADGSHCPPDLLDGGNHHDDTDKIYRQNFARNAILNQS